MRIELQVVVQVFSELHRVQDSAWDELSVGRV